MKNITLMIILLTNSLLAQKYFDDLIPPYQSQVWGNNSDYSFELNAISRNSWDPLHEWGTDLDEGSNFVISRNDTCIFSNENMLDIYDFTSPTDPHYITSVQLQGWTSWGSLEIRDNYLYVCNGGFGLEIIDITNLNNPIPIAHYENYGRPYSIAFLGDTAFVASRQAGLRVLDISDISNPTEVDSFYLDDNGDYYIDYYIDAVTIVDGKPVIGDRGGNIMVLDFSGDTVSVVSEINIEGLDYHWRLKSDGTTLYSLSYYYGLSTFDLSDLSSIALMDTLSWDPGGNVWGFDIAEDYAYIPRYENFQIINISNPNSLVLENTIQHSTLTDQDVHIDGNHAYITNSGGITAFDIASTSSVLELGSVNNYDGGAQDIAISPANHLYVDDSGFEAIRVFDLNDPTNMQELSLIPTGEWSDDNWGVDDHMIAAGNYLFYAHRNNDSTFVRIFDVSDPSGPIYISTYETPFTNLKEINLYEDNLILYGLTEINTYGFEILDITNPNDPLERSLIQLEHSHDIYHEGIDMALDGDTLISVMHCYHNGSYLYTIDFISITDPDNPEILSQDIQIPGDFFALYTELAKLDDKLYISSSNQGGMTVVDVADIQNCTVDTVYSDLRAFSTLIDTTGMDVLYTGRTKLQALSISNEMFPMAVTDEYSNVVYDIELNNEFIIISLENAGLRIFDKITGIVPIVDVSNDTIPEDSLAMISIVDITESIVTVITSSDPPYVEGSFDASEMVLTLIPDQDWYGDAQILIQAYNEIHSDTATNSFTLTVLPVNDAPFIDSLLTPTVSDTFSTHLESDHDIPFSWVGGDVDEDDILFKLTIELEFFGNTYTDIYEDITDTIFTLPANNLDPLLGGLNIDETILTWYIEVADTQYVIVSTVGEFVVTREQLSTQNNTPIPDVFALHQNYPNPFNPTTQIKYDLPEVAMVSITIYDAMGRQVKSLVNTTQSAGYRSIQWNATNNTGQPVSAGLYLYTIQTGDYTQTKKMVLLK